MPSEKYPSSHEAETTPALSRPTSSEALSRLLTMDHPERVGPYKILKPLGHGGMGVVYLAQREGSSFAQRVALKIVKRGMDSAEIVRRFELERQLLSGLNHPNIARLIDGGTTEDGRPFFALEYVEGQPIDKYCDANKLTTRQRLELFRKVCSAVHNAHQNLIVHRDLKPGNVIVTASGEPKLLDFGIAKLLNPTLFQAEAMTGPAVRLMTPEYASPEQVRGGTITTASDIYSLGVMLYEILTGRRPYKFKTRLEEEIARIICEETPEKPSTAINRSQDEPIGGGKTRHVEPTTVAATREGNIDILRKRLKGDIDDIVLKALEKTPTRRYESALQFSEDIDRHLKGEPVLAAPPSASYRIGKFVQRHRGAVAAAAMIALVLILGLTGTSFQWSRAEAARADADVFAAEEQEQRAKAEQLAAAEKEQRESAEKAYLEVARLSNAFTTSIYTEIVKLPASVAARAALGELATTHLDNMTKLAGESPRRKIDLAAAYERLGQAHADVRSGSTGDSAKALEFQNKSLELRESVLNGDPDNRLVQLALATSHIRIADLVLLGGDLTGAQERYHAALSMLEKLDSGAKEQIPARVRLISCLAKLGDIKVAEGDLLAARPLYERAHTLRKAVLDLDATPLARRNYSAGMLDLFRLLVELNELDKARELTVSAVDIRRKLVADEPQAARSRRDLAMALLSASAASLRTGDFPGALQSAREARDLMAKLTAEEMDSPDSRNHQTLAQCDTELGNATLRAARAGNDAPGRESALRSYSAATEEFIRLLASDPDNAENKGCLIDSYHGAGRALLALGKPGDAMRQFERARELAGQLRERSPTDLSLRRASAEILRHAGDAAFASAQASTSADTRRTEIARAIDALTQGVTLAKGLEATQLRPREPEASAPEMQAALDAARAFVP